MRKKLQNENGLSLIESLLSLFLFSIIGTVVYIVLMNGLHTENKIYTETLLRDEADLVMSKIINELYTAPASQIKDVSTAHENKLLYGSTSIGFDGAVPKIDGKAISAKQYDFTGSSILKAGSSIKINLNIKSKKNEDAKPLTLQSQFGLMEE